MSNIVERLRAWSPLVVSEFSVPAPAMAMDDAAAEIERLRARVEGLERVREAAEAWTEDMTLPTETLRPGAVGRRLINALKEAKP